MVLGEIFLLEVWGGGFNVRILAENFQKTGEGDITRLYFGIFSTVISSGQPISVL